MTEKYGVFVWRGDARYPAGDAVKVYTRKSAAEKFADLNIARNYVVRTIYTKG